MGTAGARRSASAATGTSRRSPADRGDQLGHGVLGGHRVVEDRGIRQGAALFSGQRTTLRDDGFDRLEDPSGRCWGDPRPPTGAANTSTSWNETPRR